MLADDQPRRAVAFLAPAALVAAFLSAVFLLAVAALRELLAGTTTFLTEAGVLAAGALPVRTAVEPARVTLEADTLPAAVFGAGLATPRCEPAGFVAAAWRAVSFLAGAAALAAAVLPMAGRFSCAGFLAPADFVAVVFNAALRAGESSSSLVARGDFARGLRAGSSSSSSSGSDAFTRPPVCSASLILTGLPPQISSRR